MFFFLAWVFITSAVFTSTAFANTGFLSNGTCFETAQEASDNFYSLYVPLTWVDPVTGTNTKYYLPLVDGFHLIWLQNGSVISNNLASLKSLPSCLAPSESFQDGINVGWLVGLVIVIAFGINQLRRVIR